MQEARHPAPVLAYERVAAACKSAGNHWATLGLTPEFADREVGLGCRMLSFGLDAIALRRGIEATKAQFPQYF